jgi:hypothetical protein
MTTLALTFDFWLALILCIGCAFIWLGFAIAQSAGGSYYWERGSRGEYIRKIYDGKKIPLVQTSMFKMFLLHLVFGGIMFYLIAADFWDVWFPGK